MNGNDSQCCSMKHKCGLVLIAAVAIIAAIYAGIRTDFFVSKTSVFILTDNALGIKECQPVVFHGFKIGRVGKISLMDDGKVRAELLIKNDYLKWVRADSTARLISDRKSVIDISEGTPEKPVIARGGTLKYMTWASAGTDGGGACISSSTDTAAAIADIKAIVMDINDPEGEFKRSIASMNRLSEGISETKRDIDRVVAHTDGALMVAQPALRKLNDEVIPEAQATLGALSHAAARTEALMLNLNSNLPAIVNGITDRGRASAQDESYRRHRERKTTKQQSTIEVDSYE